VVNYVKTAIQEDEIMRKLPQIYTDDEKANAIIAWYLNRNILQLVQDIIINYEAIHDKEA